MKIIGDPKPYIGTSLGGVEPEPEKCEHEPDGWSFDREHDAFLISRCEHCDHPLIAVEIDEKLLAESGEISVTKWRED